MAVFQVFEQFEYLVKSILGSNTSKYSNSSNRNNSNRKPYSGLNRVLYFEFPFRPFFIMSPANIQTILKTILAWITSSYNNLFHRSRIQDKPIELNPLLHHSSYKQQHQIGTRQTIGQTVQNDQLNRSGCMLCSRKNALAN